LLDEQGLRQGAWTEYYEDGEKAGEGYYLNNLRQGEWKFYFKDGRLEQTGKYDQKGRPDGKWRWFYESGNLKKEDHFKNGLLNGPYVEKSDSGKVIIQGEYIDGEEEGEWLYEVGDNKEIGSYVGGKREGLWKHYTDEVLYFEGNYIEGNPNGDFTYYWENEKIKEKGKYIMGKKEGDWNIYDYDGIKIITIRYEDGVEISFDGNKIEKNMKN
jgi:antitoxin component YwqK of YwqJK toxin-antitoxin module